MIRLGWSYIGPCTGAIRSTDGRAAIFSRLRGIGLPEGHHDLGIVPLGRFEHTGVAAGIQVRRGQVRAKQIAGEQDPVLGQVGDHRLGPVNPGGVDELQRLVAQRQDLAVLHRLDPLGGDAQVIDQQRLGLGAAQHDGLRVLRQDGGNGAGMVLLGVVRDDVIDVRDLGQLAHQQAFKGRIDGVQEGCLGRSLDQVGVVAGAVGQGDQRIEQPPVPVDRAQKQDAVTDLSWLHESLLFCRLLGRLVLRLLPAGRSAAAPLVCHGLPFSSNGYAGHERVRKSGGSGPGLGGQAVCAIGVSAPCQPRATS